MAPWILHRSVGVRFGPLGYILLPDFKMLRILHFNDVYNVERKASRFAHMLKSKRTNHLCLFSGDAFSPSIVSPHTKGMHMIELFNHLGVSAATPGNHEFDNGINHARTAFMASRFPWVSSNLRFKNNKQHIPGTVPRCILNHDNMRIGLVGIAEQEWLDSIKDGVHLEVVDPTDVIKDTRNKCDVLIALTHMSMPNDLQFARQFPEVDLVLGGHDHDVIVHRNIIKSGTDFENFSEVCYDIRNRCIAKYALHDTAAWIDTDDQVDAMVTRYMATVSRTNDNDVVFVPAHDMDATTRVVRSVRGPHTVVQCACQRICELLSIPPDCFVLLNGGTFRSNMCYKKDQPFTEVDMRGLMPWDVPLHVTATLGKHIKAILAISDDGVRNGMQHGRFIHHSHNLDAERLQDDQLYNVITTDFLAHGGDGYGALFGTGATPIGYSIQDALRGKPYGTFDAHALMANALPVPDDLFS